jgi:WD40 repeat protein
MLFSGSADKTARAWVMEFGEETREYLGSHGTVTCLQFYEGMVCTGSADGTSRLYDAKSGSLKRTFRGHDMPISSLMMAPGKVFTSCLEGNLCVWSSVGFTDETVFGNKPVEDEEESDEDCEKVKDAVKMLDNYIRK